MGQELGPSGEPAKGPEEAGSIDTETFMHNALIDIEDVLRFRLKNTPRSHALTQSVLEERERCAAVAEHLNGWGWTNESSKEDCARLAAHIAFVIRQGPF